MKRQKSEWINFQRLEMLCIRNVFIPCRHVRRKNKFQRLGESPKETSSRHIRLNLIYKYLRYSPLPTTSMNFCFRGFSRLLKAFLCIHPFIKRTRSISPPSLRIERPQHKRGWTSSRLALSCDGHKKKKHKNPPEESSYLRPFRAGP